MDRWTPPPFARLTARATRRAARFIALSSIISRPIWRFALEGTSRMACPSCDAKRAVVESGHALDALLADVPYRQSREIDAILARTLTAYYRKKSNAPKGSAPAQFHAIQRFGSSVNLHVHVHAALSDGCFSFEKSTLKFHASRPPSVTDIADLLAVLRVRVFRRMLKLNAMPLSAVQEMMTWPHSGFALDCGPRYRSSG